MNDKGLESARKIGAGPIRLGEVEVYPDRNLLVVAGQDRRLKPKVMRVLMQLIDARGAVVPKSRLMDSVWPNMAVTESALVEAVHELRRALDDDAKKPRFVETIPRHGYRVVAEITPPATAVDTAGRSTKPRVAVTHFEILSDDANDQFFCEGLCEELTSSLGRNRRIEVLARSSILELGDRASDSMQMKTRLGVTHLVNGTLRRHEGLIRVTAHLVDCDSGTQLWAETYDRPLTDMFAVQDDIAEEIGAAVEPHLTVPEEQRRARAYSPAPEAFYQFSKGRYFWKRDNAFAERAMRCYEAALTIDPEYADPHVGLVECYNTLGIFHLAPTDHCRQAALRHAERALFLDPSSPDSLFAFGYTQFYMRWDWRSAESAFLRCLAISPNHALAHAFLSLLYNPLRRAAESAAHAEAATRLDPFAPYAWWLRFLHYHYARDFERGLTTARSGLEIRPHDVLLRWAEADSLVRLGQHDEALPRVRELEALSADFPLWQTLIALLYVFLNCRNEARAIAHRLESGSDGVPLDPFSASLLAISGGRYAKAMALLEQSERERDPSLWISACEPYFDPLRKRPRFQQLMERIGLPP